MTVAAAQAVCKADQCHKLKQWSVDSVKSGQATDMVMLQSVVVACAAQHGPSIISAARDCGCCCVQCGVLLEMAYTTVVCHLLTDRLHSHVFRLCDIRSMLIVTPCVLPC